MHRVRTSRACVFSIRFTYRPPPPTNARIVLSASAQVGWRLHPRPFPLFRRHATSPGSTLYTCRVAWIECAPVCNFFSISLLFCQRSPPYQSSKAHPSRILIISFDSASIIRFSSNGNFSSGKPSDWPLLNWIKVERYCTVCHLYTVVEKNEIRQNRILDRRNAPLSVWWWWFFLPGCDRDKWGVISTFCACEPGVNNNIGRKKEKRVECKRQKERGLTVGYLFIVITSLIEI